MLEPIKLVLLKLSQVYYTGSNKVVTGLEDMVKPVGGRGHKAPYETETVRIPTPLRDEIDRQVDLYRSLVVDGLVDPTVPYVDPYKKVEDLPISKSDALEAARNVLKQKKSARKSIINLLQVIYNINEDLESIL